MCLAALAGAANAGVVNLGGGWQASWDSALDPFVDIHVNAVGADAVFIEKSAEFTGAPVGGIFPAIDIVFTQINAVAVHNIVIDDEIIHNSTGTPWSDFHMDLLGNPNVVYDTASTSTSGGPPPIGFSIAPFTVAAFASGNTVLNMSGGVVPSGGLWFPGGGASDGQLWMHLNALNVGQTYTLREQPTPAPGALALLGMAGLLGAGRRRRT
jgi:MYXO-CTERM domain-containing protein